NSGPICFGTVTRSLTLIAWRRFEFQEVRSAPGSAFIRRRYTADSCAGSDRMDSTASVASIWLWRTCFPFNGACSGTFLFAATQRGHNVARPNKRPMVVAAGLFHNTLQ